MEQLLKIISREIKNEISHSQIEGIIFEIILNHIKDMVFIMKVEEGPEFRYIFSNLSGAKLARLTEHSMGKTFFEVMPEEIATRLQTEYTTVVRTKDIFIYSDYSVLPNGQSIIAQSVLTPIVDDHGAVRFVVSVTRDVTELFEEKKRLVLTEQRYRSIVDHNLDGVIVVSSDGVVLEVNPAATKIMGYPVDQLCGFKMNKWIVEEDLDNFTSFFKQSLRGIALETLDCRLTNSRGNKLTVQMKTVPITINNEVSGVYIIFKDITKQAIQSDTIKYMAYHDQLTSLFNRRKLLRDMDELLVKKEEFALLSIDIDRFKHLNDTLGHFAGDQILIKVAERLSDRIANDVRVYRQGGDEFMILCRGSRQKASRLAQKLLNRFSKSFYLNSQEYFITPSIGISVYPRDGEDTETIIKHADEALYQVKERGKAHYLFYHRDRSLFLTTNIVSLETALRKAIDREEFILFYQPQVQINTNQVASFEALIRWQSSEFGFVSPADFIPLAEDTGLIIPIGNWVIQTACRQIQEWTDKFGVEVSIAINISPKQFQQPSLVPTIRKAIDTYKIKPELLEIEITEGAMQDTLATTPILKELKSLGVTIAIDDFGTGYSSLSYLKQFPIDVLKVDQSFIKGVHVNEKDAAIATTIIHLAKSLGMNVVAEGIEEKEQVEFLLKQDCHKGQGYYYYRPMAKEEIEHSVFIKPI